MAYRNPASWPTSCSRNASRNSAILKRHTIPGLWKPILCTTSFTIIIDYFRVKYVGKEHVSHLIAAIKHEYMFELDWNGGLYYGINLHWNY